MRKFLYIIFLTSGICLVSSCSKYFFLDSDAMYRIDARENVREFIWKLKASAKEKEKSADSGKQENGSSEVVFEVDSVAK